MTIVIVKHYADFPYQMRVERMWQKVDVAELPAFITSPFCPYGTPQAVEYDDIFDWFDCLRETTFNNNRTAASDPRVDDDARARLYRLEPTLLLETPVWILLAVFELLTAMFHATLAYPARPAYDWFVARRMQPFRWFEYSITSTIMLLAVFSLSRISDAYALGGMAICSVFLCLGGGLVFEILDYMPTVLPRKTHDRLVDMADVLKWLLFAVAWLAFLLHLAASWDAYLTAVSPYFAMDNGDLWRQIFDFILVLNVCIWTAYFSFPIVHVLQVSRAIAYENAELGYIVCSFVSKAVLTLIIAVAALRRRD